MKSGTLKEYREFSAIRMLGPYRVLTSDRSGDCVVTSNGHPLSSCHPWRRSLYFSTGGDGSRYRRRGVCQASIFQPCSVACVLCGSRFVPPVSGLIAAVAAVLPPVMGFASLVDGSGDSTLSASPVIVSLPTSQAAAVAPCTQNHLECAGLNKQ